MFLFNFFFKLILIFVDFIKRVLTLLPFIGDTNGQIFKALGGASLLDIAKGVVVTSMSVGIIVEYH